MVTQHDDREEGLERFGRLEPRGFLVQPALDVAEAGLLQTASSRFCGGVGLVLEPGANHSCLD